VSNYKSEIKQLERPYFSTISIQELIRPLLGSGISQVTDIGCGVGAQTMYLASKFPQTKFIGTDYNSEKIRLANDLARRQGIKNVSFRLNDILEQSIPQHAEINSGVISIHTLCCFRNFEPFFESILNLNPDWIVINSLFWEGDLDVLVHIRDDESGYADDNPDGDFNIFSTSKLKRYLESNGYSTSFVPFYPPEPILGPGPGKRGTYTMNTELHPRTQFSGPVHLPWSFLRAIKS